MDHEQVIRQRVRELKTFYANLTIYGCVCAFCILVWMCMGFGVFWPIWVILGCGIAAGLEGFRLEQLPHLENFLPFLKKNWEEEQVRKILPTALVSYEEPTAHDVKKNDNKKPEST